MKSLLLMILLSVSVPAWSHGHGHDEEKARFGPNKGVLLADEHQGFVLNPQAMKNFSLQTIQVSGRGTLVLPIKALLFSGMEKQVFRLRDGYWKAIDVEILKRDSQKATVKSEDLSEGDAVAIQGVGFLKIVEQSVFGQTIEDHVH